MIGSAEEVGNEYIYQNMSDEEKRIIKEQEQAKIKAEKDMVQAQIEAEKLKGKALEEEKSRLEAEKLRQVEEQKRLEEERKNKVAEIIKVEFLDKDGKVKNVFETGDDISIRVYFKQRNKLDELNFGIGIYNQAGIAIFGISTAIDKVDTTEFLLKNYFDVSLFNVPIKTDTYYVSAIISNASDTGIVDYKNKLGVFSVVSIDNNAGMVGINYKWM